MGYFLSVCTKPIWWVCYSFFFLVSSDHRIQCHLKFQSCLITEYAGDCFWMKPSRTTCGDVGDVWYFFRLSDSKTQLISAILQLWSLESLWLWNSPSQRALGRYRHTSSSRQICNIFSWLEPLNYYPDGGNRDFQCFNSFLTATFYFVMLNNLVLHIITIFLGFAPCDGWLIWPLCSSYL